MNPLTLLPRLVGALLITSFVAGCTNPPMPPSPSKTVVTVALPIQDEVPDYAYFTGRIEAVQSVEIRARVSGYLDTIAFKPGAEVKKGDLLFQIDPRPYQAELDRQLSEVSKQEAALKFAEQEYKRVSRLVGTAAVSREEFDKIAGNREQAAAALKAAQAAVEGLKLNLEFCRITAPISGIIGRNLITEGNLVTQDSTLLTTIVSLDPIYAYFDVDEQTVQRIRRRIQEGKFKSYQNAEIKVGIGLATEQGYPHVGVIDFVDNKVNPSTGTLSVRAVVSNEHRTLRPGYYCRVRLPVGPARKSLLVMERALGSTQGQRYLLVVNSQNVVEERPVQVGPQYRGLRVIEQGLKPDELVIVNGLLRVRPGVMVEPQPGKMLPASAEDKQRSSAGPVNQAAEAEQKN